MKILMSIGLYSPFRGGAESQAALLSQGLLRRGADVSVVTQRKRGLQERETVDGVPVRRVAAPDIPKLGKYWHLIGLDQALHTTNWDIVHAHGAHGHAWVSVRAAHDLRRKSVVKFTNTGERFDFAVVRRWFWPAKRMIRDLLTADRFIVMNEAMRAEAEANGVPAERISIVPNAVDTARFRPAMPGEKNALRKKLGFPEGFGVIFVGSFQAKKNPELVVQAFARLAGARPAFLAMVGDGPLRSELEAGARGPVFFPGQRTDVDELLRAADAFILPSGIEGQPNALLEAMATGLPCVASDIAPHRELLGAGAGLLTPADPEALAAALESIAGDAERSAQMGREARARIERDHDQVRVLDRLQTLYGDLLAGRA